jgi:hypothetical protein
MTAASLEVADRSRQDRRTDEDQNQQVLELIEEQQPR